MMNKYLLLIDDEPEQEEIWEDYLDNIFNDIGITINFDYINPLDYITEEGNNSTRLDGLKRHLDSNFLNQRIDVIASDYNWDGQSKDSAFKIIDYIRTYNQVCNLFMYSGTPHEMMQFAINDVSGKQESKRISTILTKSKIADFVPRKATNLIATIKKLISTPSLGLQIENHLMKFQDFRFEYGYEVFKGKPLKEIAIEVRKQTPLGAIYTQEIIKKGLNHMIELEIPEL